MHVVMRAQRGTALLETALVLPVMLVALYGVTWGVRVGTIFERAEGAVRYAGVIAAQQSPYNDYSFFTLYNNLGSNSSVIPQPCQTPPSLFLTGGAIPVVPGTPAKDHAPPAFWQPDSTSVRSTCAAGAGRQTVSGADFSRPFLLLRSTPKISASVSDIAAFGDTPLSGLSRAQIQTTTSFYRSPDLATLMHCEDQLSNPVSLSLAPQTDGRQAVPSAPLTDSDLQLGPVGASANCATAAGTPAPLPSLSPYEQPTGSPAPPSGNSPTPTPPTPRPKRSPSPSPSPKVTPSPATTPSPGGNGGTGGGGGGGNGGNGSPSPSPKPGGNGGGGGGGGKPTGSPATPGPSGKPVTPAPSVMPRTPKPSTPAPTSPPTPKPSPTSNGTVS